MTIKELAVKRNLESRAEKGQEFVIWRLNKEQRKSIEKLGYNVEEYLFEVTTKQLQNKNLLKSKLLKEIHYMNKKGRKKIVMTLNKNNRDELTNYEIEFRPIKFIIYL